MHAFFLVFILWCTSFTSRLLCFHTFGVRRPIIKRGTETARIRLFFGSLDSSSMDAKSMEQRRRLIKVKLVK